MQPGCVAEELLPRLLLEEAEATLDLCGLLDGGVEEALGSFRENVYEDLDHEWLYEPAMDGIDQDPAAAVLGIAPMGVDDWFRLFNAGARSTRTLPGLGPMRVRGAFGVVVEG